MDAIRKWSEKMTLGRDKSHSIEHFGRVEDFINQIIQEPVISSKLNELEKNDFEVSQSKNSSLLFEGVFSQRKY